MLGSRSNVEVKVTDQGQRSRSIFWRAAVDIRGSTLPSAVKSNRSHYQSKVFVCVSIVSRCMRIIARMRLIGFYFVVGLGSVIFISSKALCHWSNVITILWECILSLQALCHWSNVITNLWECILRTKHVDRCDGFGPMTHGL